MPRKEQKGAKGRQRGGKLGKSAKKYQQNARNASSSFCKKLSTKKKIAIILGMGHGTIFC